MHDGNASPIIRLWRIIALCTAGLLLLCMFIACANADDITETIILTTGTSAEDNAGDNDAQFDAYVHSLFYPSASFYAENGAGIPLSGAQANLYALLLPKIRQVAAGGLASTVFELNALDVYPKVAFTAADLGVTALVSDGKLSEEARAAIGNIVSISLQEPIGALRRDLPYDMYWYDATLGTSSQLAISMGCDGVLLSISGTVTIRMSVVAEYQNGDVYVFNTARAAAAVAAAANAGALVNGYAGLGDTAKLTAYKNAICDAVSYNYDALGSSVSYGNPWQLVWVFDGDPSTNVVCEGYAKAFQYLCDMSSFSGGVAVFCVSGVMGENGSGGAHMWNIIGMNNQNYLADITNCDSGSIGYPSELFLVKPTYGDLTSGFYFAAKGQSIYYQYSDSTRAIFADAELSFSSAVELETITAVFAQGTTAVYENTTLEALRPMLAVNCAYSDGTVEYDITDYALSGSLTAGTSAIIVSYGGLATTFSVTVTSLFDHASFLLCVGDTQRVSWGAAGADRYGILWSSSDEQIAMVDGDGDVTALQAGTATITAAIQANPVVIATCQVNVVQLDTMLLPASLEWIREDTFAGCGFARVIAGEKLAGIEDYAFRGCAALRIVELGSATQIAENAFAGCGDGLIIVCPKGAPAESYAKQHNIPCYIR